MDDGVQVGLEKREFGRKTIKQEVIIQSRL